MPISAEKYKNSIFEIEVQQKSERQQNYEKKYYEAMETLQTSAKSGGQPNEHDRLVRGLSPMRKMVTEFPHVVDYRSYRLLNYNGEISRRKSLDMFHSKHRVDGSHPTLATYDAAQPVRKLSFL